MAKEDGETASEARQAVEKRLGKNVISPLNASDKPALEAKKDNNENKD